VTQRDREKRLDVVGKLLAQATSVAGTPEADVFTSRAFALIAKLGIGPESDATVDGHAADAIVHHGFELEGDFLLQRMMLLARIAWALHCDHAYWQFSNTASRVAVCGAQRHVDRIQVLYDPLLMRMLRQATTSPWSPSTGLSLRDHQISWMQGFTVSIRTRLREAEAAAAAEADHGTHQHALDAERAAAEMKRQLPTTRRSTYHPTLGFDSVVEGIRAGKSTDKPNRR